MRHSASGKRSIAMHSGRIGHFVVATIVALAWGWVEPAAAAVRGGSQEPASTGRQEADAPQPSEQEPEVPTIPKIRTAQEYLERLDQGDPNRLFEVDLPDEETELLVRELRRRFAFQSLGQRLDVVEQPHRLETLRQLDRGPKPDEKDLPARFYRTGGRLDALKELHEGSVREFVSRPGFGFERLPRSTPYDLPEQRKPIALKTRYHSGAAFNHEPVVEAGTDLVASGIARAPAGEGKPATIPQISSLTGLHENGASRFARPDQVGFVRARDQVAGFTGHAVDHIWSEDLGLRISPHHEQPELDQEGPERWHLNRMELVGLLASDEFRVYVSEHLPDMDQLQAVATRKLDEFELAGLARLMKGEELATGITPNRIRMLGALRANNGCVQCHSVEPGTLLGALSYELLRTPAVPLAENHTR